MLKSNFLPFACLLAPVILAGQAPPNNSVTPHPHNSSQASSIAKTIDVVPPASFGKGSLPRDTTSEFALHGKAGQFLRLSVDQDAEYDSPFSISVQGPDSSQVKPLNCPDSPVFPLRQTGIYRIHFDPAGLEHTFVMTVLSNNAPLLDPGLKPDQVLIDLASFAHRDQIKLSPYCGKDYLPAALALTDDHIWLRIMQVAGYETFFSPHSRLSKLNESLGAGMTKKIDANDMPPMHSDGAAILMTACRKLLSGDGWRGWRWVQGEKNGGHLGRRLWYEFQGITNDGRLFFVLRVPISNENSDKEQSDNRLLLERALEMAAPASFQPGLAQVDAIVQSTRFTQ
jgi:hypothetical protein